MIDAKQLMIDNIVKFDSKLLNVCTIGTDFCVLSDGIDTFDVWYDEVEPIPLTEKVLEACGFTKREPNRPIMLLSIDNEYNINDNICSTLQCWVGNDYITVARSGIGVKSAKCNSLHQLQNLHFTLTQNELQIDLDKLNNAILKL